MPAKRTVREVEYRPMIRDIPTGERPRERLRDRGADSLSNSELLAILLRTGTRDESALDMATKLLSRYQGLEGLAKASFQELDRPTGWARLRQRNCWLPWSWPNDSPLFLAQSGWSSIHHRTLPAS